MYSEEELLIELRNRADENRALPQKQFDNKTKPCSQTYKYRFRGWWRACVRAGLRPQRRRPLTPKQYQQFHSAALAHSNPVESVYGLLLLITGLPLDYMVEFSPSWCEHVDDSPYKPMITVPPEITSSGEPWTLRIPEHIHSDDEKKKTELPGLLRWFFNGHYNPGVSTQKIRDSIKRIAADIRPTDRELTSTKNVGTHPLIRPADLRASTGVHLARRGASSIRIRNHLGIEHTNWKGEIEDFFLWCHVHDDDFSHPESEINGIYLDPDSGDVADI